MKLIECIVLLISISLFGSIFAAMIVPLGKNAFQLKKMEQKLERDKFIVNAVKNVCSENDQKYILIHSNELINDCSKLWNLDSFFITEMKDCYKAEWSFNNEVTTFFIKKG